MTREHTPKLILIIPCYNEAAVLPVTAPLFLGKLRQLTADGKIADTSRLLFVDDGSRDGTWDLIKGFAAEDPHVAGIRQSRNRGHQNAVLAGLMEAKDHCDITISLDCDGQDDVGAMDEMIDAWAGGAEIVYGVRNDRETDSFFKRFTAARFYKLMNRMGVESVYNHADYRLVSSRVLQAFADFREVNIYLRGMFPLVGFPSTCVYYRRQERLAGRSHYPLSKMAGLAADGITSLSIRPIRIITALGFFVSLVSLIGILWILITHFTGHSVPGWASTTAIICFATGIQMLSLGIIGEYVGKIYLESKHRPRYIISERTGERGAEEAPAETADGKDE